jgi:hypothetical protein
MGQYYTQNVTIRRNAVAFLAIASLAATISAFQYLAARVQAGFATMSRRQSGLREHPLVDDVRNRELQQMLRQSGASPRGLFDPLFSGLSADAAGIDAAICRRTHLR